MKQKVSHTILPNESTFNYDRKKYHVVAFIHDKTTDNYVYMLRYYGKYKQYWHYVAMDVEDFDMKVDFGLIKNIRRKRK